MVVAVSCVQPHGRVKDKKSGRLWPRPLGWTQDTATLTRVVLYSAPLRTVGDAFFFEF